jgi:hypothetical protein
VQPGEVLKHVFPEGYSAHWVRVTSDAATSATAWFTYAAAAPVITGVQMPYAGGLRFTFSGPAGWPFSVRATDNLSLPLPSWPSVTTGAFTGQDVLYQDSAPDRVGHRFFSISIP